jgi:hypothetical protein
VQITINRAPVLALWAVVVARRLGEDFWVELCGRGVPVKKTADGVRAVVKDKPIEPAKVQTYLEGKKGWGAQGALDLEQIRGLGGDGSGA